MKYLLFIEVSLNAFYLIKFAILQSCKYIDSLALIISYFNPFLCNISLDYTLCVRYIIYKSIRFAYRFKEVK